MGLADPGCRAVGVLGNHGRVDLLATQMLDSDIEVPCPGCCYPIWVLWAEVVAQASVVCPACRRRVHLVDHEGGMQNAPAEVEQIIRRAVEGLFE
jgi:hypothetical protein